MDSGPHSACNRSLKLCPPLCKTPLKQASTAEGSYMDRAMYIPCHWHSRLHVAE